MKKVIYSIAMIAILGLFSKNAQGAKIRGAVNMIGGNGISDITFKCNGISGICCEGDISLGGHISITGFPGDWVIVNLSLTPNDDGSQVGAVILTPTGDGSQVGEVISE
jgi:hypothetical protein